MKLSLFVCCLLMPFLGFAIDGQAGPYHVQLTTQPEMISVGKAMLELTVTDSAGKPEDGLTIHLLAQMPGMPMGERDQLATPSGPPGHYQAPAVFAMAGAYDATVLIEGPLGQGKTTISLQTGESTSNGSSSSGSTSALMPFLAGMTTCGCLAVAWRLRGRIISSRIVNRATVGGLGLVVVVFASAYYVVGHFRRPGSMTPVQAQTMDMAMPPPAGQMPVTLTTVKESSNAPTISYPGQVSALTDSDVAARTTGIVEATYVYVGDHVRKGQLLAKLDVSQLNPELAEKQAMLNGAVAASKVAEAEALQAKVMVHQAESEKGQFEAAVPEAKAMLAAATEDVNSALAQRDAAKSNVDDASSRVAAAKADATYWIEEMKRESRLLQRGAVSKDEYAQEQKQATVAASALTSAERGLDAARANLRSSEAQVRKANAGVSAVTQRVNEAESTLMVHHAHVQTAQAETESATGKIGQARAGVLQAKAVLDQAVVSRGYAELRASEDGVVTARMVSPGSLVSPGQVVFKVSVVSTLRVQANVPEAEIGKIRLGSLLMVRHRDVNEAPTMTPVTSISPSVDPVSRMGVVEGQITSSSLHSNRFRPGEYVTVDLPIAAAAVTKQVPSQAVQTILGNSGTSRFVWVAKSVAGQAGRLTVERHSVEVGTTSSDSVAINSGVEVGERVVLTGGSELQDGDVVTDVGTPSAPNNNEPIVIEVDESGFSPSSVTLTPGQPHRLVFLRKTDNTCATEVEFPSLGIKKSLPLHTSVTIELPPSAKGTLGFACGMSMKKGTVIVQ